ncbi:hypothetical protein K438DRAFT_1600127 [Mycena galopus ATCC 62051]|nr:hypothetical protein K438DRAFT_1600127 [Mycena galopus ATCC 62051]
MWIAHFAPALALKPFFPNLPMWALAMAGSLPDAIFFVNAMLGIEEFRYSPTLNLRGCFPYANDYPYSHSLVGEVIMGLLLSGSQFFTAHGTNKFPMTDFLALFFVTSTHYILDATTHRPDMVLTPSSSKAHGTSLFDSPSTMFLLELGLMALAAAPYLLYTSQKPTASGLRRNAPRILAALFVVEQFQFCYLGAPTTNTRWVHAPMLLSTILTTAAVMSWVDGTRVIGSDGGKKQL